MKRAIVITDLTRFAAGNPNVCTAGIDRSTGECIRPMPYIASTECRRLKLVPGGILTGDFVRVSRRTPPHTEDCYHSNLRFQGPCRHQEFRTVLARSCFPSVEAGFDVTLPLGEKVIPPTRTGPRSIITLQIVPSSVQIVEGTYQPGTIRLHFVDSVGRHHRFLPITDLGFHSYAQRHREQGALEVLNKQVAAQKEVFVRIGLSRIYKSTTGREGFWLQVNGIYTFPDVLGYIRSDMAEGTRA